jgi:hypothetical protein
VLTDEVPYKGFSKPQVTGMLFQGIRPPRPSNVIVDDREWELISKCWSDPPEERPSATGSLSLLRELFSDVEPSQPNTN